MVTSHDDLPEWITTSEVAAAFHISRGLVYEMARRGDLPSRRFGRLLRFHRSVLDANDALTGMVKQGA